MSFESNSNVRKRGKGIALNGWCVYVQALTGTTIECMTFSTKDGQDASWNNSCHIYPTAQRAHVYWKAIPPFCRAVVKMDSDAHHHDSAQKSGPCLDRRWTLIQVHLYTCMKV